MIEEMKGRRSCEIRGKDPAGIGGIAGQFLLVQEENMPKNKEGNPGCIV